MNISVIMAAYNGELYIEEQIASIVSQLEENDELIISDDGSTDKTKIIIKKMQDKYPNIVLIDGPKEGIAANFENGVCRARNEIIAFTDQDDIWVDNKVLLLKMAFKNNANVEMVMHNAGYIDADGKILAGNIFDDRKTCHGFIRNLIRSTYYGCCMAFRREFISRYYNNVTNMKAYDQYLGLCAEKRHVSLFIDELLIYHRIHLQNESRKLTLPEKIRFRMTIIRDYFHYTNQRKGKQVE